MSQVDNPTLTAPLTLIPIGVVHSPFRQAAGTPVQPFSALGSEGQIEIYAPYADGLLDLEGFARIWVLYWCHRAAEARLRVVPYRDVVEHGVFATRAPARPNPIGISAVRLLQVQGATLSIAELDMLDGTPVLDVKPYVSQYDSYPEQRNGWLSGRTARPAVLTADQRFEEARDREGTQ